MPSPTKCPHCAAALTLHEEALGRTVQCPHCLQAFQAEDESGVQAHPPAPRRASTDAFEDSAGRPYRGSRVWDDDSDMRIGRRIVGKLEGRGRARLAQVFLVLCLIADGLQLAVFLALHHFLSGNPADLDQRLAEQLDSAVLVTVIGRVLLIIPGGILFLMWFHSAYKNLTLLGADGQTYSPGWAVGYFFVPFLNLVRPYQVAQEIWKGSDPHALDDRYAWKQSQGSGAILAWWLLWISENIVSNIALRVDAKTIEESLMATKINIVACILSVAAGLVLLWLISAIVKRQQDRYDRLYDPESTEQVGTAP